MGQTCTRRNNYEARFGLRTNPEGITISANLGSNQQGPEAESNQRNTERQAPERPIAKAKAKAKAKVKAKAKAEPKPKAKAKAKGPVWTLYVFEHPERNIPRPTALERGRIAFSEHENRRREQGTLLRLNNRVESSAQTQDGEQQQSSESEPAESAGNITTEITDGESPRTTNSVETNRSRDRSQNEWQRI